MSFYYGNANCESYGMYVEKYPNRPFPVRKVTTYNIPGKNGDLIVDHGGYENVIQEYEVYVKKTNSTMQDALSRIANWLLRDSGYAVLRDDYNPSIFREARVVGGEVFMNSLNKFGRATLQFDCKPQRFPYPAESLSMTLTQSATLSNDPYIDGKPLIKISGILYGHNEKITLRWRRVDPIIGSWWVLVIPPGYSSTTVYVDFELKTAYIVSGNEKVAIAVEAGSNNPWYFGGGMEMDMSSDYASSVITATIDPRRYSL